MKPYGILAVLCLFLPALMAGDPEAALETPLQALENGIEIGASHLGVLEILGEPDRMSESVLWEATGEWGRRWHYGEDLTLTMFSEDRTGNWSVGMIRITGDCSLKTAHGIGIGATRELVLETYGQFADEYFTEGDLFVAGCVYGGVGLHFENDEVTWIFIGPMAE